MTDLLGGAGQSDISIEADDKRAMSTWYMRPYGHSYGALAEFNPHLVVGERMTGWWPGGGGMLGDAGDVTVIDFGNFWCPPDPTRGCTSRYGFTGYTQDVYGSPVSGVTVKCYHTADDVMVATTVSDTNGYYLVTTPYGVDSHYLVFYKAGAPDIFGTTQNTLVGS